MATAARSKRSIARYLPEHVGRLRQIGPPGYPDAMETPLVHSAPVTFLAHLGEGHLSQGFDVAVATNALSHVRRRHLPMRECTLEQLERELDLTVEASADTMGGRLVLARAGERELVELVSQHGAGQLRTAADTAEAADALLERLADALREQEREEDPRVAVWFWTLTEHGPQPLRRRLHAPAWSEIAGNYVMPVREALDRIMGSPPDAARGIALWRGAPGTGKTTALRALAREWRDHADVHVIVDPEVFLGDKASYLVEVLFGTDVDEPWDDLDAPADAALHGAPPDPSWGAALPGYPGLDAPAPRRARAKLIVLEDAGELISAEARVSAGQALSRLLNLTDGMLGQGSNVSVLVTTNEPIERLHPAIARPGRGWAHIEFRELPVADANGWLERAGSEHRVQAPVTLAELYALLRGDQVVSLDDLAE